MKLKGGGGWRRRSPDVSAHTSHVAVVDLPPPSLSLSLTRSPSISCFSPLCQDVSGVSQHGLRP